jgi:protein disulfide-isomerase A1
MSITLVYAPWCGHCQTLKPIWDKVKKQFSVEVQVNEINSDESPDKVKALGITGFPTIFREENGKQIKYEGDRSEASLTKFFNETKNSSQHSNKSSMNMNKNKKPNNNKKQGGGFLDVDDPKQLYTNLSIASAALTAIFFFLSQR